MSVYTKSEVAVKLFAGCLITTEIRIWLNQSSLWKQEKISPAVEGRRLVEVHYKEHDYIGCFLPKTMLTLEELRPTVRWIEQSLLQYCPELKSSAVKICFFPQIFLS